MMYVCFMQTPKGSNGNLVKSCCYQQSDFEDDSRMKVKSKSRSIIRVTTLPF